MASELEKRIENCKKEIAKLESTKSATESKKADAVGKIEDKKKEAIAKFDEQIAETNGKFNAEIAEIEKKLADTNARKKKLDKALAQQKALFAALDGLDDEDNEPASEPERSAEPTSEEHFGGGIFE